jgi:glycine dehydrogenase
MLEASAQEAITQAPQLATPDATQDGDRPEDGDATLASATLKNLGEFARRHIGPDTAQVQTMLAALGYDCLEHLMAATVPAEIRLGRSLALDPPHTEAEALARLRVIAAQNEVSRTYIGMGYAHCHTPPVIQRNILENPGWYTAYTPYQAEIAQGRLEMLLNFQTLVSDLTGMDLANASLLDEGTAVAEAMSLAYGVCKVKRANRMLVADTCHPQTLAVLRTRAQPLGIELEMGDWQGFGEAIADPKAASPVFAVCVQYPDTTGAIADYRALVAQAHAAGALVLVAADLLALTLLTPPGAWGADVVVGSAQRLGVPLGFGGPHAAFFATREVYKRQMPGRIVGVSKDAAGNPALRLSLQTREQHIRRDKATSNICTAQVLLAVIAAAYGIYHGADGLRAIAQRIRTHTLTLAQALTRLGYAVVGGPSFADRFDTLHLRCTATSPHPDAAAIRAIAEPQGIDLRYFADGAIGISLDETTTGADLQALVQVLGGQVLAATEEVAGEVAGEVATETAAAASTETAVGTAQIAPLPEFCDRQSSDRCRDFLTHPTFTSYRSETELLRYLHRLEAKDIALNRSMIPLGSCTMKLNATAEMIPVTWPEFGHIHPYAPARRSRGYAQLMAELEADLAEITGFAAVSLQPNAGSQGEYAGLLAIRAYHASRNEAHRNICLIPTSAHGTNPASAVMAGLKVVAIACDDQGNIDLNDLRTKADQHRDTLAALMITYPSTHGVFEAGIRAICDMVHACGGQVYMDGANMNAQVGLCRPGDFGADVCHLNLHKTFCIPHGGGGPGVGPIGVAAHLVPFLPATAPETEGTNPVGTAIGMVAAAPAGSASILPISWMYIKMMGATGLTAATAIAILNANYLAHRLDPHFPVLYRGAAGTVAHECILDLRLVKKAAGIEVDDVAKRLMDFGFHAPTVSWPVLGTVMVEPTESESLSELERFCAALIAIREEIRQIEAGTWPTDNNPLKHAPHTAATLLAADWDRPYPREQGAYPLPEVREDKYWPPVERIDNAWGDRNLVCSCESVETYANA